MKGSEYVFNYVHVLYTSPKAGCFSCRWLLLVTRKLACKKLQNFKKLIIFFSQDTLYSLKAHAHYFTAVIHLATWRNIFMLNADPQLLFMSAWSQSWLLFFILPPPPQKFLYYPLVLYSVSVFSCLDKKHESNNKSHK